eukprot:TRINITY_DN4015_c0_g1_i1.p1 TRINITY_DN4015_c0_g1~~TRINITY_DN4015_c0_g1_i1.p1  ORF type:complete len:161 (+),score=47.79 TRINITY_DN4015_c0_g1_i1:29-484(+)
MDTLTSFFQSFILYGAANGGYSKIAHYTSLSSVALMAILGLISFVTGNPEGGIVCIVVGLFVTLVESTYYVPLLRKYLDFFIESYLWRAVSYSIFSLPLFFSWITAIAGLVLLGSGVMYCGCWWLGEKQAVVTEVDLGSVESTDYASEYQV